MKAAGVRAPAPLISLQDLNDPNIRIFKIGRFAISNAFLLERCGYGTIYVKPSYQSYRKVYTRISLGSTFGRDIDHLWPRSSAPHGTFVALGCIPDQVNRSHQDNEEMKALVLKGMGHKSCIQHTFAGPHKAGELGRFAQNGYIQPMFEYRTSLLQQIGKASFRGVSKNSPFPDLL